MQVFGNIQGANIAANARKVGGKLGKLTAYVIPVGACLAMAALPSFAVDPVDPDYALLVSGVQSKLYAAMTLVFPIVGGLFGVTLAIRWVQRSIRGVAK
jgi:hypothetical protein